MKNYLDGPGFAAWMEETIPETIAQQRSMKGSSLARAIHRWKRGDQVTVESADRWLTHFAIPLAWVPEGLWRDRRSTHKTHGYGGPGNGFPTKTRRRAVERVLAGESIADVATELGCSHKTIEVWRRVMLEEVAA